MGGGQNVVISGNTNVRVFQVFPGGKLTLRNITVANGRHAPPVGDAMGGGLLNDGGDVVLADVSFTNCVAQAKSGITDRNTFSAYGGAIFNTNGQISGTRVTFVDNLAMGRGGGNGTDGRGGAIASRDALLRLTNMVFAGNRAEGGRANLPQFPGWPAGDGCGGAFYMDGGSAAIEQSIFSNNQARAGYPEASGKEVPSFGGGGAVFVRTGIASFSHCGFSSNYTFAVTLGGLSLGGAVFNTGTLSIRESTFRENNALMIWEKILFDASAKTQGGGLFNGGTSVVERSVFYANSAAGPVSMTSHAYGGAICNASNSLAITNCTFAGNRAAGGDLRDVNYCGYAAGYVYWGGIHVQDGMVALTSVTLSGNGAFGGRPEQADCTNSFGGSFGGNVSRVGGSVILKNTIVANSVGSSNGFGGFLDAGNNLSSDSSCAFTNVGSMNGIDPRLGPLAHYGGETKTIPLLSGSVALDAGSNPGVSTDQRGRARPFGPAVDIGAFESSPPYVIRGPVTGYLPPTGIIVHANENHTPVTAGTYSFENIPSGDYTVSVSASNTIFTPSIHPLSVGPDQVDVHFHGYQSNAFTVARSSPALLRIVFAAQPGAPAQLLFSTNLSEWSSFWSNSIPQNGLIELNEDFSLGPNRFFKASRP